jgi:hypothetical protein
MSVPFDYFALWVALLVILFCDGLIQSFATIGIATVIACFAYGGLARTRPAVGALVRDVSVE